MAGSDPHNPDTDGDGVPDGQDGCPLDPDIQPPRLPSFGDRYTVIDLSERGLLEYDKPYAINDAEQISGRFNGQVNDNYLFHEFLWQAGTRTAVPANFYVGGHRPSSAGALAGHVDKEINDEFGTYTAARAALWYPQQDQPILLADPTPVDLGQDAFGDVPRKFDSHALAINDSGAVVGLSQGVSANDQRYFKGVFWTDGSVSPANLGDVFIHDMPNEADIGQWFEVAENALNSQGAVGGRVSSASGWSQESPCFWQNGQSAFLPILPEEKNDWHGNSEVEPTGINNWIDPWIVGGVDDLDDYHFAVPLWVRLNGQWVEKHLTFYDPMLQSSVTIYGRARAVNDRGQVLGDFAVRDTNGDGYYAIGHLWQNGRLFDGLYGEIAAGWAILPVDINNRGVIVGYGAPLDERGAPPGQGYRPVLLRPVRDGDPPSSDELEPSGSPTTSRRSNGKLAAFLASAAAKPPNPTPGVVTVRSKALRIGLTDYQEEDDDRITVTLDAEERRAAGNGPQTLAVNAHLFSIPPAGAIMNAVPGDLRWMPGVNAYLSYGLNTITIRCNSAGQRGPCTLRITMARQDMLDGQNRIWFWDMMLGETRQFTLGFSQIHIKKDWPLSNLHAREAQDLGILDL